MTPDTHKALIDRLSRAEGQIRALKETLRDGDAVNCREFITQVKAVRSALRAVSEQFIIEHIEGCQTLPPQERQSQMNEAIKLLTADS